MKKKISHRIEAKSWSIFRLAPKFPRIQIELQILETVYFPVPIIPPILQRDQRVSNVRPRIPNRINISARERSNRRLNKKPSHPSGELSNFLSSPHCAHAEQSGSQSQPASLSASRARDGCTEPAFISYVRALSRRPASFATASNSGGNWIHDSGHYGCQGRITRACVPHQTIFRVVCLDFRCVAL